MQTVPITCSPCTLQPILARKLSIEEDISAMRQSGFSIDFHQKQAVSHKNRSVKKRLEIFKQYNPRTYKVGQNDDTVVYKKRRGVADSEQAKNTKLSACQRQFECRNKLIRHGSDQDLREQHTRRRQNMFSRFHTYIPKQQISFQSMKKSEQETPATTQRFRKNKETVSPMVQEVIPLRFQNCSAKTDNKCYNSFNNEYLKAPSLYKAGLQTQLQTSLTHICEKQQQIKPNFLISPKKITFTYQNSNNSAGVQQPSYPTISNTNLFREETFSKAESPYLKRSVVQRKNQSLKNSVFITNERSSRYKKTVDYVQKSQHCRTKQTNKSSQFRWGNKIRTQLMRVNLDSGEKPSKQKDFASSKITLNQLRQSLIINGDKISRQKLKLNESFSNVSDDQSSSKRYFDDQVDCVPQVKKVSYGNIDISRQDFVVEQNEQFKPNQLLIQIENNKFEPQRDEDIVASLGLSQTYKSIHSSNKSVESATERNILQELQSLKSEQIVKQVGRTGKILPVLLVLLASMLFVIQAIV